MIEFQNVTVKYNNRVVLDSVSGVVKDGQWLMVVGPNGAGKSTLIKAIASGVEFQGDILLNNISLRDIKSKERARKIAILQQQNNADYDYTVEEVVSLGRYAYSKGLFQRMTSEDQSYIDQALNDTGMTSYRKTSIRKLSGGELQRTFLAQVLAQNPDVLILDEPTNHLDLKYEQIIFELVNQWINKTNKAVISIVHDLSLAKKYGTHGLLLKAGIQKDFGYINNVLAEDNLTEVYDINVYKYMQEKYQTWK